MSKLDSFIAHTVEKANDKVADLLGLNDTLWHAHCLICDHASPKFNSRIKACHYIDSDKWCGCKEKGEDGQLCSKISFIEEENYNE